MTATSTRQLKLGAILAGVGRVIVQWRAIVEHRVASPGRAAVIG